MSEIGDTRQRIIETAIGLFHARSYDSVGVQEICDTAEVTKGSFYHFFGSKEDLGLAVIDSIWDCARVEMDACFDSSRAPLDRIELSFAGMYQRAKQICKQHGRILGCPFGNLTLELSTRHEPIRERLAEVYQSMQDYYCRALHEAKAAGQIEPHVDPETAARNLVALMQGMAVLGKASNDPSMMRQLVQPAMAIATGRFDTAACH